MSEGIVHDVIIIGGGVTGAAAAIQLARAGKKALLLEKETQAHHKVCGEFISFEAEHYLKDLGLDLPSLSAERINNMRLIHGKKSVTSSLPFTASSLSRFALDDALLEQASSLNANVMRGVTVNKLIQRSMGWSVETSQGEFNANAVFLATGKHDLRGWSRPSGNQNDFIGFKMHFRLHESKRASLSDHVEIILFKGGYAGLEPVEDNKANLCLVVKKSDYIACGKNWQSLLGNLLSATPYLSDQLADSTPCWDKPLAVYGIPYGFLHSPEAWEPPNLYRIGDQIAVIPSFSGEGISIALHTAHKAVSAYLNSDAVVYHHAMKKELSTQIKMSSLLSYVASSWLGRCAIILTCRISPQLLKIFALKTRIKFNYLK